jgi:hypothetical protein
MQSTCKYIIFFNQLQKNDISTLKKTIKFRVILFTVILNATNNFYNKIPVKNTTMTQIRHKGVDSSAAFCVDVAQICVADASPVSDVGSLTNKL